MSTPFVNAFTEVPTVFVQPAVRHTAKVDLDTDDDDDFDAGADTIEASGTPERAISESQGRSQKDVPMVETDEGRLTRVPPAETYPGEVPYGAPISGFHGKVGDLFDAFIHLRPGHTPDDRPKGFLPVVGLTVGDSVHSLYGRLRPEFQKQLAEEMSGMGGSIRPVIVANALRADNLALFTVTEPQKMFAPSLWLATMPIGVLKMQIPTLEEPKVRAMLAAERAFAEVERAQASAAKAKAGAQLSLGF